MIQQFSGITVLNSYAVKIFNEVFNSQGNSTSIQNKTLAFNCSSHIENTTAIEAYISGISTVLVRLASSLLLAGLLAKFGRRSIFMTSALVTMTFMVCFATLNFFIQDGNSEGMLVKFNDF